MPTAILSVYDKTGLVDFARALIDLSWRLLASGGTARLLANNGIPVTEVAEYTRSPEMLGGRVKTLHPAIHGGLLARATDADQAELAAHGWGYIDLVVSNLYPFEATSSRPDATFEQIIEDIDVGGVTLIRAAAKNHDRVTLVCEPADYSLVLSELWEGGITSQTRRRLAIKGFEITARYDRLIADFLTSLEDERQLPSPLIDLRLYPVSQLRYGENPHQEAMLYNYMPGTGPLGGHVLHGKALSYNNLLDLDAAWRAVVSFDRPSICIVKHLSPCGLASADQLCDAFRGALASDPISAYGGVIAANRNFDEVTAASLGELFVECIAAPGFTPAALELLSKRKNLRLLAMPSLKLEPLFEFRSINNGLLRQSIDLGDPDGTNWQVVSQRQPTALEFEALHFAWKACQHVKSNAIVFAQGETTVGIGGGQPNRVDCVRIAAARSGERAKGAVMASDAFFPFPDSVEEAARAGITAIVAPGGSVRDAEAVAAANAHQIAMVFTGVRHFRH